MSSPCELGGSRTRITPPVNLSFQRFQRLEGLSSGAVCDSSLIGATYPLRALLNFQENAA